MTKLDTGTLRRSFVPALSTFVLAACVGCTNANVTVTGLKHTVGGSVSGLATGDSLELQDNGGDNLLITSNGAFTFHTSLAQGAAYSASVVTQPAGEQCTVSGGSGTVGKADITAIAVSCTVTVSNNSPLDGVFTWVNENVANESDSLSFGTLDGAGTFSGTSTNNTAGQISAGSPTGVYSLGTNGVLTVDDNSGDHFTGGIVTATANSFVLMDVAAGEHPSLTVGVKPNAAGATDASLQGTYSGVDLEVDANGLGSTESVTTLTLDGAGNASGSQTTNRNGVISAPAAFSGTYSVAANGEVTGSGGSFTGAFTADAMLLVAADLKSGDVADLEAFVKVGTNESLATLSGTYTVAILQNNAPGADGFLLSVTSDGNGNFTGIQTENNAGTITTGTAVSGAYTLTSNGKLTLSLKPSAGNQTPSTAVGAVSADGRILVFGNLSNGAPPNIGIGLQQ